MVHRIGQWMGMAGVILMVVAGWTGAVGAESGSYRNYGEVRFGLTDFTDDMDDAGYDSGANFAVAYGRYLTPNLVVEAAIDGFGADMEMYGNTSTAGNYKREDSVAVLAVLASVKGELPVGPLTFFAGGGVGGYFLALSSEIDTDNLGDLDEDASDSVIGVHALAGVSYNITPRFFTGLQALYRWTDEIDINESTGTVPIRLDANLNGYSVMLTGGFRF